MFIVHCTMFMGYDNTSYNLEVIGCLGYDYHRFSEVILIIASQYI